jgi:tight adherence protein B
MNEPWLIYLLVFGSAVICFEAISWIVFLRRRNQKVINRRLELSQKLTNRSMILDALRGERGFANFQNPLLREWNDFIVQTGLKLSRQGLIVFTLALASSLSICLLFILSWTPVSLALSAVVGLVMSPVLVYVFLRHVRNKRIARFSSQLPDAIDTIVRGLRVGKPFSSAIEIVGREMPDPIGSEFGITADEITFGQDFVTAVDNLSRRVGQDDLLFLINAVSVQSQIGGNLVDILSRLARLIRERQKLRLKAKALSAEGRMSAQVLSSMPFILYAIVSLIAPGYFDEIKNSQTFVPAIIVGAVLLTAGNVVISRMVNFKI